MEIKAIVTDLDDTLLNEEGQVSPFSLQVLQECVRRGVAVIPASGRMVPSILPHARKIGVNSAYIACNGGQIVSANHEIIEEKAIPAQVAREICAFLEAEGFYVQVYRGERFYYASEAPVTQRYKTTSGMEGEEVGDLQAFLRFPAPKILSINEPERVAQTLPLARERFGAQAEFTLSRPYFLEALAPDVTKGSALRRLCELISIPPENMLVFGDSMNDASMLALGPNGVAVANARPEAKAAARYQCLSNREDGVARFIQQYVLHQSPKEANYDFH